MLLLAVPKATNVWACTLKPVFLRPSPGARGRPEAPRGFCQLPGASGFSSPAQRFPARLAGAALGAARAPGCARAQAATGQAVFSPEHRRVGETAGAVPCCRLEALPADVDCLSVGSMCLFSLLGQGGGHGGARTESTKQNISVGEEDREASTAGTGFPSLLRMGASLVKPPRPFSASWPSSWSSARQGEWVSAAGSVSAREVLCQRGRGQLRDSSTEH